jgi:3-oxoacyl-[acyl-carrier protein] reductase
MSFTLEGRTALVTGSARGIGRAIATALLASGANVVLNDLDTALLEQTASELGQPERLRHIAADLTQPASPGEIVDATLSAFGAIDIIVNNAGYTWDTVIQKMTDQQFQAMLDIHLVVPFRILRAASQSIRSAARSEAAVGRRVMRKVVNITSIAGTDGNAGQAAYSSAKAGIIGLTKTLAKEWGRYNVNVNAVGFGLIETRLVHPASEADATLSVQGNAIRIGVPSQARESMITRCPLGRLGTPEEAANAVLFFCSPLSDYVTGEVLICGGGLHF